MTDDKKESFEHWLTNSFWFHYKWYYLLAVFALTFIVLTAVRLLSRTDYDVRLCYISEAAADEAQVQKIISEFTEYGNRNGNKISVGVTNKLLKNARGERQFFEPMDDSDEYLYLLDAPSMELCGNLGYFPDAVWLPNLSLYAAARDVPIVPYTKADFPDVDYTQEQIDDTNTFRMAQHEAQLETARTLIDSMK